MVVYLMSNASLRNVINDKNNDCIEYKLKRQGISYEGKIKALKYKKIFVNKRVDYIYSSDYVSAIDTVKCIFDDRNYIIDERLTNIKIGVNRLSEVPSYFFEQHFLDSNYKLSSGESQFEIRNRMYNFILEVLDKYDRENIFIMTHKINIIYLLRVWCDIKYNDKFVFKGKEIFDGNFKFPVLFKLNFENKILIDIEYIMV